jgi:uncharacterized protein
MHRRGRSRVVRSLLWAAALAVAPGCRGNGAPAAEGDAGQPSGMTRVAVISGLATCTVEVYRAFLPVAEQLAGAAAALATDGSPERWTAARAAWVAAMGAWQEAEQFQYGPLAPRQASPGAEDIRDNLYAWPFDSACFVEQELVSKRYEQVDFVTSSLINVRGLGTAEYLLFYAGPENHCPPTATINSSGSWAALAPDELAARKRRYAAVVAADVARRARDLLDAWEPAKRNFLAEVTSAGAGSKVYSSTQVALNAMSHALFYIEHPTKDVKLGRPLGLRDCAAPPCLDLLESPFARRSKSHIARNVDGFEKLAFGCPAGQDLGFDDLLGAAGGADLASRMRVRLPGIRAALEAIPGDDFKEALVGNLPAVQRVYEELRQLIVLMKTEFVSTLNLELPRGVQSDQD